MTTLILKTQPKEKLSSSSQTVFDYLNKAAWHPDTLDISDEAIAENTKLELHQISKAMADLERRGLIRSR